MDLCEVYNIIDGFECDYCPFEWKNIKYRRAHYNLSAMESHLKTLQEALIFLQQYDKYNRYCVPGGREELLYNIYMAHKIMYNIIESIEHISNVVEEVDYETGLSDEELGNFDL